MKKTYIAPALDIIEFDIADIITQSNAGSGVVDDDSSGDSGNPPRREGRVASFSVNGFFTPN